MVVVNGACDGAPEGAGLGAGVVAIGATGGSTLGEQAANTARQAKGVISIKRLRVGVCIWGFLVWSGLSLGCRGSIARPRTDALTWSNARSHIACASCSVSVRWCTVIAEVAEDSQGSAFFKTAPVRRSKKAYSAFFWARWAESLDLNQN